MKVVVAYDVSDDDARARLAAMLAAHGARIQRSVFECLLDPAGLEEVLAAASRLIDERRDVLHAFPVCERCAAGRSALGQDRALLEDAYWIVL